VGIDLKRALITENYGVQKSLIVLYPTKYLHTEFLTNLLICIRKVLILGCVKMFCLIPYQILNVI
jgi:hypothetical protein